MAASLVAAEDDYGVGARRDVMEEFLGAGEVVGPGTEVAAEEGGRPGLGACLEHDGASWSWIVFIDRREREKRQSEEKQVLRYPKRRGVLVGSTGRNGDVLSDRESLGMKLEPGTQNHIKEW